MSILKTTQHTQIDILCAMHTIWMDFLREEIRSKFEYAVASNRYIKIENGINPISINNNECVNNPYPFAFAT